MHNNPAPLPNSYSGVLRQLVMSMLSKDPNQRPSAQDLLKHPILMEHVSELLSRTDRSESVAPSVPSSAAPRQRRRSLPSIALPDVLSSEDRTHAVKMSMSSQCSRLGVSAVTSDPTPANSHLTNIREDEDGAHSNRSDVSNGRRAQGQGRPAAVAPTAAQANGGPYEVYGRRAAALRENAALPPSENRGPISRGPISRLQKPRDIHTLRALAAAPPVPQEYPKVTELHPKVHQNPIPPPSRQPIVPNSRRPSAANYYRAPGLGVAGAMRGWR